MPIDKNQLRQVQLGRQQGLDKSQDKEQDSKLNKGGIDASERLKSLPIEVLTQLLGKARSKGQSNVENMIASIIRAKQSEAFSSKLSKVDDSKADGGVAKRKDPESALNEMIAKASPEEASTLLEGLDPKQDTLDTRKARLKIKAQQLKYNAKAGSQELNAFMGLPSPTRFNEPQSAKDAYLKRTPTIAQA